MSLRKLAAGLIVFVLAVASNSQAGEVWKITSLDWQPYAGSEFADKGRSVAKLQDILKKRGIEIALEFYPWRRSKEFAKTIVYVGYFPAWPSEVGEGFVASDPIDWSIVGMMQRTSSQIKYENVDQLFKRYRVGIVSTYVYPKAIMEAMAKYPQNVDKSNDEVSLLRQLSAMRHDVSITDPNVMMYLAKQQGITNVIPLKEIIEKTALVIAFRDDAENRARIELLKELMKSK